MVETPTATCKMEHPQSVDKCLHANEVTIRTYTLIPRSKAHYPHSLVQGMPDHPPPPLPIRPWLCDWLVPQLYLQRREPSLTAENVAGIQLAGQLQCPAACRLTGRTVASLLRGGHDWPAQPLAPSPGDQEQRAVHTVWWEHACS